MRSFQDIPQPSNNSPIDPSSTVELIVFIALPILLIITYFLMRKRNKKNRD